MYALIDLTKVREVRSGRFYETIPDGRAIVPFSELRAFGSMENVDIVATATELKKLIEKQKEQGIHSSQEIVPGEVNGTITGDKEQTPTVDKVPSQSLEEVLPQQEIIGNGVSEEGGKL